MDYLEDCKTVGLFGILNILAEEVVELIGILHRTGI